VKTKEVSVVTIPMNPKAKIISVKNEDEMNQIVSGLHNLLNASDEDIAKNLSTKMNENHDDKGRFASGDGDGGGGGGSTGGANAPSDHSKMIATEMHGSLSKISGVSVSKPETDAKGNIKFTVQGTSPDRVDARGNRIPGKTFNEERVIEPSGAMVVTQLGSKSPSPQALSKADKLTAAAQAASQAAKGRASGKDKDSAAKKAHIAAASLHRENGNKALADAHTRQAGIHAANAGDPFVPGSKEDDMTLETKIEKDHPAHVAAAISKAAHLTASTSNAASPNQRERSTKAHTKTMEACDCSEASEKEIDHFRAAKAHREAAAAHREASQGHSDYNVYDLHSKTASFHDAAAKAHEASTEEKPAKKLFDFKLETKKTTEPIRSHKGQFKSIEMWMREGGKNETITVV
jgi:hypothetical protein